MDLNGKNVLITGANRGIGRAFLDESLTSGAAHIYAAVRRPETLADEAKTHGDRLSLVAFDLDDPATVTAVGAACPDVDVVIICAAGTMSGPALASSDADVRQLFEQNVFAPLELLRVLEPALRRNAGAVLLVSSVSALIISRSSPIYSATKAAGTMIAGGVRAQLADSGVTVSISYPGFVDTDMTARMEITKASPRTVAARSLAGLLAGDTAIFPDRYAEIVEETLLTDMPTILRDPQEAATAAVRRFRNDERAGD